MPGRTRAAVVLCVLVFLVSAGQASGATTTIPFAPTGSMATARGGTVAAALPDGRVLVAGGDNAGGFLASGEIFNPLTGSFSPIASMKTARFGAVAAPLPGGVLVAGGYNGADLATAEVFNAATGSFSPVSAMASARSDPAAAPLPGGRVLVAGGENASGVLRSAVVYSPATGFTPVAPMAIRRDAPAAAPLPDGRVLIAGGFNGSGGGTFLSSAEVYDPATNSFSPTGSMGTARIGASAAALPDGRVLVVGGSPDDLSAFASAEIFDPATNSFSSAGIGSMGTAREGPGAAPLPDGRVLVAGGQDRNSVFSSAETFATPDTFTAKVKGRKLIVSVPSAGTVQVAGATSAKELSSGARAAKRHKRKRLLRPSRASGGPGKIRLKLKLTGVANRALRQKGKLRVAATITFSPDAGFARTEAERLKVKTKRR